MGLMMWPTMQEVRNKHVTVAGLGRFGGQIAAARWLVEQGARVLVTDQSDPAKLVESTKQLEGLPIEWRLGEHREQDFSKADVVVASPAIPLNNPFLKAARVAGVPITTEIRLFIERCPATILGVTGSKGKSTTTALLGRMLRTKYNTYVGGNIGKSLLFDLPKIEPSDLVVLELSSYMLEHVRVMKWSPHVGVVTMIAHDHLEWHGSFEAYVDAKKNIFRFQRPDDYLCLNRDNEPAWAMSAEARSTVVGFSLQHAREFELIIPGRHNQLNAQAAYAAAEVVGVSWEDAQTAIRDFKGLPHRLELVHERHGVRYYNDSIATIPEAAVAALESFPPKSVIQIVGGSDKHLPLTVMCNALVERAKAALCIGTTGPTIAAAMGQSTFQGGGVAYECHDLPTALAMAKQIASPGDVVLLSPGCASYDQFVNFEQRGEMFAKLARGENI